MMRASCMAGAAVVAGLALGVQPAIGARQQRPAAERWVTAWGTSQNGLATTSVTNTTVRMLARVTVSGDAVRIRLDNTFGAAPLVIGRASVGQRIQGAALAAGSNRAVLFNRSAGVTVPAGGTVTSDAVALLVLAQQDLAVTLHVPEAGVRPSQHGGAFVTSYAAPDGSGDLTADESGMPFTATTTNLWWVKAIDVSSSSATGSIVAFGDSITDGTCTTLDAHDRWEDLLAVRLALDAAGRGSPDAHKAIVNEGIAGNTVTRPNLQPPPDSPPGVERLDRDVLSHHGVTHVVVFMGTNDIRREAPAAQVIAGMQEVATRVKARGLKVIGVTIIPRHNRPPVEGNTGWSDVKTRIRGEVNQWIRTRAPFDAVIDFNEVVRDRANADLLDPRFNCGDGIHPSPRGYYEMGRAVRLDLFR
ncbi:MAG: SGNH/GDSL hydrolase family protein [Acidobacteria bacterium]|nr:SGNH/GDSL hydrolase family protein [Acidobacteriota bacterium]